MRMDRFTHAAVLLLRGNSFMQGHHPEPGSENRAPKTQKESGLWAEGVLPVAESCTLGKGCEANIISSEVI